MTHYAEPRNRKDSSKPAPEPDPRAGERGARSEADLRRDAEAILRAAVTAVDPGRLVAETLRLNAPALPPAGRIHVVGFGVAAAAMARGARSSLGDRIADGVLVVPAGTESEAPPGFDTFGGGLPVPDQGGVAGASAIRQLARELAEGDTLLCLVSGGGSSLLTLPPEGLPLEDVQKLVRLLIGAGAPESDIDRVHRHVDALKGGRLAVEAAPADVFALVLSDVAGDAAELVACGPFAPESGRPTDAVAVLKRYGAWREVPLAVRGYLDRARCRELPNPPGSGDPCFARVRNLVVGDGSTAARAACLAAEELGYEAQLLTDTMAGEARKAGEFLAATARSLSQARDAGRPPVCVVAAGTIRSAGAAPARNGPNQELVLSAATELAGLGPVLVASMDTRGTDGHGAAAGAIATGSSMRRAAEAGPGCREALETGAAARLLETLDDLIVSGPTGTDVGDLQLLLLA